MLSWQHCLACLPMRQMCSCSGQAHCLPSLPLDKGAPCRLWQASTCLAAHGPHVVLLAVACILLAIVLTGDSLHCTRQHIKSLEMCTGVLTSQSSTRLLAQPSSMAFCLRRCDRLVRAL